MRSCFRRLCAFMCVTATLITSAAALSVEDAIKLLEETYINDLPASAYSAQTLNELFESVGDPYTYYMTAEEYEAFMSSVEVDTTVTGIGAAILFTQDGILISSVLPGGGAEEAGLQSDDLIIAVEGVSCVPANESHRSSIIGEEGTYVTITVRHRDGTERDYRIERRQIEIARNTNVSLENGVGLIDCDSFGTETGRYFAEGIEAYDDDAHIWVVDLRGNTGGVSTAAVAALGTFTGSGPLLYFRDRAGDYYYNLYFEEYLTPDPVIVLSNNGSASASEIFSAGVRDKLAGISIGSRTYGKGSAQSILNSDRYEEYFDGDALKVTVYRFFSVDGNTTDRIGVIPTLLVSDEHTAAVAELLCAKEPSRPNGYLSLKLAGWTFYVDLEKAQSEEYQSAFMELLSALPPNVAIQLGSSSGWNDITPAMAVGVYGAAEYSRTFSDVSYSAYADKINTLAVYGILQGTGDGCFKPEETLTRAQLCALLAQALNVSAATENHFTDVSSDRWFADPVNAMAEMGLVEGVGGGRFDPNSTVTHQEYITIMGRLASFLNFHAYELAKEITEEDLAANETLTDFAAWAKEGAVLMTTLLENSEGEHTTMLHDELENIDPTAPVLREEAAATLYNLLTSLGIIVC